MTLFAQKQDRWMQIVKGNDSKPHELLGMHEEQEEERKHLVVRVFCPTAKKIWVIPLDKPTIKYPLKQGEIEGTFAGIIPRRKRRFLYQLACEDELGNYWEYIDPYQFQTQFTKQDKALFLEGEDYAIHKKLGANIDEIEGVKGVRFAVWAPHAKRVSVIGEFNAWDGRKNAMRLIETTGIWELFIPDIEAMSNYKYEIKTQEDILLYKADPYAKYSQLRPDNASIVYDADAYQWKDKRWMKTREKKAYYKAPVSIYEVHIGSWKRHEDGSFYSYREVAEELAIYVNEMGYTHIELMGIIEHPYDGSWGYQVTGYFAPTSRYGTPDDFKYFVETMHKHQIGVLLDWVPAHFPKDAFGLEKFDGLPTYEYINEKQAEHPHWGTLIFDYGKKEVSLFLIASAISWLENYHIDGLRVDAVASMLYLDYGRDGDYIPNQYGGRENLEAIAFLKQLNTVVYSKFKGVMMIAEESTAWAGVSHPVEYNGLGFGFKWNMGWMNDFLSYMQMKPEDRKYHHGKITFSLMYAFSENFIQVLSHDEVVHGKSSMIYKMPGNEAEKFENLKVAYAYLFMHPGKKMMFMGNEFAQTSEWSEEKELDWNLLQYDVHKSTQQYVKDLNHLYQAHPCLWKNEHDSSCFEWIDCSNAEQSIISFIRKDEKSKDLLLIVINFTGNSYTNYKVGAPVHAKYEEIFSSNSEIYGGDGEGNKIVESMESSWHGRPYTIEISIPSFGVSVFSIQKKLDTIKKENKKTKKCKKKAITD